jgi:hypothetical protein
VCGGGADDISHPIEKFSSSLKKDCLTLQKEIRGALGISTYQESILKISNFGPNISVARPGENLAL